MKKSNIEKSFVQFIIDKYNPSPGTTASKSDNKNPSPDDEDTDEEETSSSTVEKLLIEYKKIKDQYEYYRLQNKRG
jgi:hypothetical protein